ncbi:MAG: hypothetical protein PHC91_00940, partial [Eubacteriales bacterium]|nr:hypothetical protein [Eubacteriales bacterium]
MVYREKGIPLQMCFNVLQTAAADIPVLKTGNIDQRAANCAAKFSCSVHLIFDYLITFNLHLT